MFLDIHWQPIHEKVLDLNLPFRQLFGRLNWLAPRVRYCDMFNSEQCTPAFWRPVTLCIHEAIALYMYELLLIPNPKVPCLQSFQLYGLKAFATHFGTCIRTLHSSSPTFCHPGAVLFMWRMVTDAGLFFGDTLADVMCPKYARGKCWCDLYVTLHSRFSTKVVSTDKPAIVKWRISSLFRHPDLHPLFGPSTDYLWPSLN